MAARRQRLAVAACERQAAGAGVVDVTVADAVSEAALHANAGLAQIADGARLDQAVGPTAHLDPVAQAALDDETAQDNVRRVLERHDGRVQRRDSHRRSRHRPAARRYTTPAAALMTNSPG